ncbi:acyl-CoA N-acyltransferase [Mycena metata]|uniref:Acyl-CoA N-acyltransferase n=1 Tax=Mycena metata TaxID=1033252 RepID=A0AAD7KB47_9AGAR|nr:acyl-CoA N-acyltransferase [Mycena metata]
MSDTKIISTEIVFGKNDQKIIAECHRIRKEVFHLEQGFPLDTDVEDIAVHFLLRVTEQNPLTGEQSVKAVGTIRGTTPDVYPAVNRYKLSRLAVHKDYRKHRFGRLLVESLHEWIAEDAKTTHRPAEVEAHSQIPAMGFYAKFGYTMEGAQFDEDGEPHQNMVVRLPIPN